MPHFGAALGTSFLLAFAGCGSEPGSSTSTGGNSGGGTTPLGGGVGNGGGVNTGGNGGSLADGGSLGKGGTSAGGSSNSGGTAGSTNSAGTLDKGGASTTGGSTGSGGTSAGGTSAGGTSAGGARTQGGSTNSGGSATSGTSTTGGAKATGGTSSTGGAMSGGTSSGGTSSGGTPGSGGGGGGTNTSCPNADPAELSLVSAWLNNTTATGALPTYAYNNIKTNFPAGAAFNTLACSIAASCKEFAPMESNWLRKCEAVITSAIVAESSYTPSSVVVDSYATRSVAGVTANDPTVGLLQIRFSSTVHDYNYYGPPAKMAAIGCTWPAALSSQADAAGWWATNGGTTYLTFMQDPACNIALATWYYFYNATGNGGASAVWISNYCSGQGVAGTMVTGLLSHLMGGNYPRPADANNAYPWGIECCPGGNPSVTTCTGCTGRVAAFLGIGTTSARPSPDPFLEQLAPEPSKYCK